ALELLDGRSLAVERRGHREIGLMLLGAVAGALREPADLALRAQQGRERHVAPEPRAVLAHPPAGVGDAALLARLGEQALGQPGLAVLGGVEGREVVAEDLVGRVALQPLGTRV